MPAQRRKDPLWARLTVILGALIMMASGGAIVGSKVLIGHATSSIETQSLLDDSAKTEAEGGRNLDGPIDMLLLGLDARARLDVNDTRADTIIILHIPATHDQAYLISIPRDTEAEIPPFPASRYPGGVDKINAAFYFGAQNGGGWAGGATLMAKTVKKLTGLSFDGAAIIDFGGFKRVIDTMGTIHMCVDHEVTSKHMKLVDGKPMFLADARTAGGHQEPVVHKVGCRDMPGWEALDYARQRYGLPNGDYDRQRHQQQLIKAMANRATSAGIMTNPIKLNRLIQAAGKAFILDTGGIPIADFIFTLKGVASRDLMLLRTNSGTFSGNGRGREVFNEETRGMFDAIHRDRLPEFLITHPGVIANEK